MQDSTGHVYHAAVAATHLLMPGKYIVSLLPDVKVFGRACKYINDPSLMSDLK